MLVSIPISKLSGIYLGFVDPGLFGDRADHLPELDLRHRRPHGHQGHTGPQLFRYFSFHAQGYYYVILFLLVLMVFCTNRILKSRTGRAWISIRENEAAAASIGINTSRYKT